MPSFEWSKVDDLLLFGAWAMGEGRQDIVAECLAVQGWIDSALVYYDQHKDAIFAAQDEASLTSVVWNFADDIPCADRLNWRTVMGMFEN